MPKSVIQFPIPTASVAALVVRSEAVHRAQDGDRRTLRVILAELAINLESEAEALLESPEDVWSTVRNLAHYAGCLRSIT